MHYVLVHEASNCSWLHSNLGLRTFYDFSKKISMYVFLHRILIFKNSFISFGGECFFDRRLRFIFSLAWSWSRMRTCSFHRIPDSGIDQFYCIIGRPQIGWHHNLMNNFNKMHLITHCLIYVDAFLWNHHKFYTSSGPSVLSIHSIWISGWQLIPLKLHKTHIDVHDFLHSWRFACKIQRNETKKKKTQLAKFFSFVHDPRPNSRIIKCKNIQIHVSTWTETKTYGEKSRIKERANLNGMANTYSHPLPSIRRNCRISRKIRVQTDASEWEKCKY